jgi:hypothetical protein
MQCCMGRRRRRRRRRNGLRMGAGRTGSRATAE